jgi:hypothetical protein
MRVARVEAARRFAAGDKKLSHAIYVRFWLSAAASVLSVNVRCQVDEREDSESAERQQWVDFCRSAEARDNPP